MLCIVYFPIIDCTCINIPLIYIKIIKSNLSIWYQWSRKKSKTWLFFSWTLSISFIFHPLVSYSTSEKTDVNVSYRKKPLTDNFWGFLSNKFDHWDTHCSSLGRRFVEHLKMFGVQSRLNEIWSCFRLFSNQWTNKEIISIMSVKSSSWCWNPHF